MVAIGDQLFRWMKKTHAHTLYKQNCSVLFGPLWNWAQRFRVKLFESVSSLELKYTRKQFRFEIAFAFCLVLFFSFEFNFRRTSKCTQRFFFLFQILITKAQSTQQMFVDFYECKFLIIRFKYATIIFNDCAVSWHVKSFNKICKKINKMEIKIGAVGSCFAFH